MSALVEGNSIRSTERMTEVHRDTIMRLLVQVGEGCERLLNERMRGLTCQRVQIDEAWAFIGKKQRHLTAADDPQRVGDDPGAAISMTRLEFEALIDDLAAEDPVWGLREMASYLSPYRLDAAAEAEPLAALVYAAELITARARAFEGNSRRAQGVVSVAAGRAHSRD